MLFRKGIIMLKEYTSVVNLSFGGNNLEANSKEEYIERLKDIFYEEYGIELTNEEITVEEA
jgi:hypothetical protein